MFQGEIRNRLDLLDKNVVDESDTQLHLMETRNDGAADLLLDLHYPCILFKKLEDKKLKYFLNDHCADYVMYEYRDNVWIPHIFELKRSIGTKEWDKIKKQFAGAMQNALAIAGFLGIDADVANFRVYSVYRNDKLNDYANPAKAHYKIHMKCGERAKPEESDWNQEKLELDFIGKREFVHSKIRLDVENGEGRYSI